ncbi:hypothetical protein ACIGHG_24085 [Bacillus sp. NPDC077411]|uniref:hypothetical protein n=1 Tax=Bacillus sp. NPDC077411 TaxID=3363947 RepID=UPI0037C8683F
MITINSYLNGIGLVSKVLNLFQNIKELEFTMSRKLRMSILTFVMSVGVSFSFFHTPSAYANTKAELYISSNQYSVVSETRYYKANDKVHFEVKRSDGYGADRILKFYIEDSSGNTVQNHVFLRTISFFPGERTIPRDGLYRMRLQCKEESFIGTIDPATGCKGYAWMKD